MLRGRLPLSISTAAALTLACGLCVTGVLFAAISQLEYDKMTLSLQQRAGARVAVIERGIDDAVEVLNTTNQLFAAIVPVTREQFRDFTAPLLQRHPYIQAFSFHRHVPQAQRPAFEADLRRIVPGHSITELRDGLVRPATDHANYLVIDYLEPLQDNIAAFGLNVRPNGILADALEQSLQSSQATATGLLALAQGVQGSFVILRPVYRHGLPLHTLEQRRAALSGETAVVIRSRELVWKILSRADLLSDPQLEVSVYASASADPQTLIFQHGQPGANKHNSGSSRLPRWLSFDYHSHYDSAFASAGRPWHVRVVAHPRPFLADHLGSLLTLAAGLLFSVLTAAFVQSLTQRSRRVQKLVEQRTADLKHSNELLSADVRARQRTERALQESEKRFRRLLALSSDWYWEQDVNLCFTHITSGFSDKSNMPPERFIGMTRWHHHPEMRNARWGKQHIAQLEARLPFSNLEYSMQDRDGQLRWFSINGEPLFNELGEFRGYRGTGSDITERKLAEQQIQHIAHHDVLTGLPNRALLRDRLTQAMAQSRRKGCPLWVLLIDLDRFKFVNDSLGHKAGDLLLKTIAARLMASLRDSDTVARLSGDEFVAILSEQPDEALSAAIVQRVMDTVAQPVLLDGKEFFVTCSIGVAVYDGSQHNAPGDVTLNGETQNLIEQADIAMYCAKKQGRNNIKFYTSAMNQATLERLRIETALRNALEREQFVLHYQPQLDLASGRIVGVEALLRWRHPDLGMVAPQRFIALAEDTGLIVPIGAWVLRQACAQVQAWHAAGLGPLRLAVNLSARQFNEPNLVASIATVLAETQLPPACLELELTESLFMHDVALAVSQLHDMKALGVQLSIDDFGTGYSSFAYLRTFPIDVLKIDRSFINDVARDADDAAIVVSIIALAHNLKLRVVAEGVETAEQLDYLRRHGCDEVQGFYFSQPLPPQEIQPLLQRDSCVVQ
ncbi:MULTISPECIES: EAL domain-containing protein [unclassified Janthinobacterium]|uniref:bifunctional diguanylate cyclase/phosphodiesterase n=1 Tax=unclassified Janthinobacterium TaxID=2610881 RepID=UPI001617D3A1|nr:MULTISPECIES: EAL domain-containing protein [unclassified Janthinobacterium]MBB5366791.1 diguanylate cyclase (GGDEF)-like protein/PAS domain S-box-containing protein [Janthinobacterium sp. K2C7]MBB5380731.1 diguanylate cyclase (GGDEF)-like protein/PAS domain S-box-containing protein [Janthinobacterium sp. K2Li3]MBB5385173.1 diguanylate cyclase (GGDEF)-like protein/PAS domain S-box-containing protein [Janthinobacterium sp. K2E3]